MIMKKISIVILILMLGTHLMGAETDSTSDPAKEARMAWWREARFGLFIHWGLYSIPAGTYKGESSKKNYAEWIMNDLRIPHEEYSALAKEFNPTKFNPDEWAELAHAAGMGYFIFTTKHHDGFALFDSDVSDYNVVDATPYNKDIFAALAEAFRKKDMRVGAYYSHDVDWNYPQHWNHGYYNLWDFTVAENDRGPFDKYMYEKSLPQVKELCLKYHPDLFWFDVPCLVDQPRAKLYHDLVRTYAPDAIINGRLGKNGLYGDYKTPGDNGYFTTPQPTDWEAIVTVTESWGYRKNTRMRRSPKELISRFSSVVCSGGNFVVNVGPKADGTLPDYDVSILKAFAAWMDINKEAIHGTQHNPFQTVFPWGGCTAKGNALYLHVTDWHPGMSIQLPRIKSTITEVQLLGDIDRKIPWKQGDDILEITVAGDAVHEAVSVIKITCNEPAMQVAPLSMKTAEGYRLDASHALSRGNKMIAMRHENYNGEIVINTLTHHHSGNGHVAWEIDVDEPGTYEVIAEFRVPSEKQRFDARTLTLTVNKNKKKQLNAPLDLSAIKGGKLNCGALQLTQPGKTDIALTVDKKRYGDLYLKAFYLERR